MQTSNYKIEIVNQNHVIVHRLLVWNKNTWNYITVYRLFVLDWNNYSKVNKGYL